jgi:hypothetical protein
MTKDYPCPLCGADVPVSSEVNAVYCPQCQVRLAVDHNAEFIDGMWIDQTQLINFDFEF